MEKQVNEKTNDYRLLGDSLYRIRKEYDEHKTECKSYQEGLEQKIKAHSTTIDKKTSENNQIIVENKQVMAKKEQVSTEKN